MPTSITSLLLAWPLPQQKKRALVSKQFRKKCLAAWLEERLLEYPFMLTVNVYMLLTAPDGCWAFCFTLHFHVFKAPQLFLGVQLPGCSTCIHPVAFLICSTSTFTATLNILNPSLEAKRFPTAMTLLTYTSLITNS